MCAIHWSGILGPSARIGLFSVRGESDDKAAPRAGRLDKNIGLSTAAVTIAVLTVAARDEGQCNTAVIEETVVLVPYRYLSSSESAPPA